MYPYFHPAALIFSLLLPILISTCTSDHGHGPEEVATASIEFNFVHKVGDKPLQFDSVFYKNAAGNDYSVTELRYYLSNFTFYGHEDEVLMQADTVIFINAREPESAKWVLRKIPPGHYHTISFVFGLLPEKNISMSLPLNNETLTMPWPDAMGGGYHFMKLEGRFIRDTGDTLGYLTHIGNLKLEKDIARTEAVNQLNHFRATPMTLHLDFIKNITYQMTIGMDVNGWYSSPHQYDFNADYSVETMSTPEAQNYLRENGKKGVFTLGKISLAPGSTHAH